MKTFTKKAVTFALIVGAVGGLLPFVLSYFEREPVESLGIAWVTEVFAVVIVYCCKSYFETKQEHKQMLENYKEGMYDGTDSGVSADDMRSDDESDHRSG